MPDADTSAKRFSAMNIAIPWRGINALPTGAIDQAERQAVLRYYSGILFLSSVAGPPAGSLLLSGVGI